MTTTTTITAEQETLNAATRALTRSEALVRSLRGIAAQDGSYTAKEAYCALLDCFEDGASLADELGVTWNHVAGKTAQWKTVAPWAERAVTTAIDLEQEARKAVALAGAAVRAAEERAAEIAAREAEAPKPTAFTLNTEPVQAEKAPTTRKSAETNPLTYELLAIADTAEGLDFGTEAKTRGMTYDSVNAPIWHYARRNVADLVAVRLPGERGKRYFTRRAWDAHRAAQHPEITPVAWPRDAKVG